ncbi:hypothetical protein [Xanthovirga aplysinae]|uniref:hypothetical protein n=1 Tax=Xanthovirga aplysinae TaxID=2529853 RepID=UPI0012BD013E|nr:hypothetical protein [Xanthovirga aplysinae]MTI33637.1 hypothetical protein [Xanthovirga aplysinae]
MYKKTITVQVCDPEMLVYLNHGGPLIKTHVMDNLYLFEDEENPSASPFYLHVAFEGGEIIRWQGKSSNCDYQIELLDIRPVPGIKQNPLFELQKDGKYIKRDKHGNLLMRSVSASQLPDNSSFQYRCYFNVIDSFSHAPVNSMPYFYDPYIILMKKKSFSGEKKNKDSENHFSVA